MNHIELIDTLLAGNKPDRTPVSFWRHFFRMETTAHGLAKAMLDFQTEFGWDLMKVNPRASCFIEPWGAEIEFSGDNLIKPQVIKFPVNSSSDWAKIIPMSPDSPAFAEQIQTLHLISSGLRQSVYFLQTVFSPLSIAGDLVPRAEILIHDMKNSPRVIHQVLENITESLIYYCDEILKTGAAGIFFATTEWASRDTITEDLYAEFGKPYDLKVLDATKDAKFNVLHVCKANNMLNLFSDYPFRILSYADTDPGNMNFAEAHRQFPDKIILGGIDYRGLLLNGSPENLIREAEAKSSQIPPENWIVGPSCAIPPEVPIENLRAMRRWADSKIVS